jgi:hypothetical protein
MRESSAAELATNRASVPFLYDCVLSVRWRRGLGWRTYPLRKKYPASSRMAARSARVMRLP